MGVRRDGFRPASWGALFLGIALLTALPESGSAQDVTFSEDVAPIIQENCQICHRPGAIGPMPLMSYQDVRTYAPLIRMKVENRLMPPWQIDPGVGIQEFKNDRSLSAEEVATIFEWIDTGMAEGDPANLPAPTDWAAYDAVGWQLEGILGRPPDIIVESPKFDVVPNGQDQWYFPITRMEQITQPRWIKAAEIRPGSPESRYVFHHANSALAASAAGKDFDIYPEDAGSLVEPGEEISWNLHFFPIGEEVTDAFIEVGVWFYPEGEQPEFRANSTTMRADPIKNASVLPSGSPCWKQPAEAALDSPECMSLTRANSLVIPPNGKAVLRGIHRLEQPIRLHSIRGHMHMRGRHHTLEAIYPDGRYELVNKLDFDQRWHIAHVYEDHVRPMFPAGTVLIVSSYFDNTAENPTNPDPGQWVTFGRRSASEMSHLWLGVTYFDNDEDFERVLAEQRRIEAAPPSVGDG